MSTWDEFQFEAIRREAEKRLLEWREQHPIFGLAQMGGENTLEYWCALVAHERVVATAKVRSGQVFE